MRPQYKTSHQLESAIQCALDAASHVAASIFVPPENSRAYECSIDTCGRPAYASNLCNAHYIRKRAGKPMDAPVRARKRDGKCAECEEIAGAKGGWGLCQKHYRVKRYKTIKDALIEALGGSCSKCGGSFHRSVYDFHHRGDKSDSPSRMLLNASVKQLAEEISKCVLLCANCHRMEHNDGFR